MSKIDDLIKQCCPNGVEYKELGEVLRVNRGRRLTKKELSDDGPFVVYHGSKDTPLGKYNQSNAPADTVIVVNTGGIGGVAYCKDAFWCSDGSFYIGHSDKLNNKFVYYFLVQFEDYFLQHKRVGGVPTIDRSVVENVKIPVPPLPVQEEIVRVLDAFTALEAELEAELEARKRQYEYYRNKLLTFDENTTGGGRIKFMQLGEVCKIYDGTHTTPKYTCSGIKFVSVENINDLFATKKYISVDDYMKYKVHPKIGDVFMTRIGSIGNCAVVDKDEDLAYYVSLALIRPNNDMILSKYLKHIIESCSGRKEIAKRTLVNAVPIKINLGEIGKIVIPVPSLEEQERIVAILDKFDSLVNDISEGLPAELTARRQQYEYYRNKLLTFTPLASEMN